MNMGDQNFSSLAPMSLKSLWSIGNLGNISGDQG